MMVEMLIIMIEEEVVVRQNIARHDIFFLFFCFMSSAMYICKHAKGCISFIPSWRQGERESERENNAALGKI
jgi:hypothetical protein